MQNRSDDICRHTKLIPGFAIALIIMLSSCGGGISGTGDGSVIADADNLPDAGDIADGDIVNTTGFPSSIEDILGPNIDNAALTALLNLSTSVPTPLIESFGNVNSNSSSDQFVEQLTLLAQELLEVGVSLASIENPSFEDSATSDNPSNFFDTFIEFSDSGTDTLIQLTDDNSIASVFSENSERIIYALLQDDVITVRRTDIALNSVFQAALFITNDSVSGSTSTIIEAAFNNNDTQTYLQTLSIENASGDNTAVVFTRDPTDPLIEQQREIIDSAGTVTDLQTCIAAQTADACQSDDSFTAVIVSDSGIATANTQFELANAQIATVAASLASPIDNLPMGLTEAVIADSDADQPLPSDIQCGLQLFDDAVRAFCFEPLPLEINGDIFLENVAGGVIFYQRIAAP